MKRLPHARIQKLVERLEDVLPEMLTFLDGLAQPLTNWQVRRRRSLHPASKVGRLFSGQRGSPMAFGTCCA